MNDNMVWMASDVPKFVTPVHWEQVIDRKKKSRELAGGFLPQDAGKGCQRIDSEPANRQGRVSGAIP